MNQIAIPVEISLVEVERKQSLGKAITYCYESAGLEAKQIAAELGSDKGQLSRWESGGEGVVWPKLSKLMDTCGNDAPLLWMAHARGYDLHAMRKRETELQAELRRAREENAALRRVLMGSGAR
ncbi:MAG: hypothetical protein ABS84_14765 [Rubrivivax sp. SCN 71-131]|nr:MAG: hypothetical protein ABS84_14765 [Rubrivivax sp. SCN 71-131]